MTDSYNTSESDNPSSIDLTAIASLNLTDNHDSERADEIGEQLKNREQQWWQARQHLINLKERQVFWFGESSIMMWLLWQLVSYVVVALIVMLTSKMLNLVISLEQYLIIFTLQTFIYMSAFFFKGNLANLLQDKIHRAELKREQSLNEMIILASDSLFPSVYNQAPVSLQSVYEQHKKQIRLVSLYTLLKHEINAGRLILQQQTQADLLPLELAEDELNHVANEMVYRSLVG